jgi:hypothetical protein
MEEYRFSIVLITNKRQLDQIIKHIITHLQRQEQILVK